MEGINKFVTVEDATEMGHMTKTPPGVRSTTTKSNRGKTARETHYFERLDAAKDAQSQQAQEPGNKKTRKVFMIIKLADGFIVSDQPGAYPRTSHRGYKFICEFYIYGANRIKSLAIKSRHASELLRAH